MPTTKRPYQLRTKPGKREDGTWFSGAVQSTHATLEGAMRAGAGRLKCHPQGMFVRGPGGKCWEVV